MDSNIDKIIIHILSFIFIRFCATQMCANKFSKRDHNPSYLANEYKYLTQIYSVYHKSLKRVFKTGF